MAGSEAHEGFSASMKKHRQGKIKISKRSVRGIFCGIATVCGTTPSGLPTPVGSAGPIIAGIIGLGAKYGLYALPTCGIPVRYGLVACENTPGKYPGKAD